MMMNRRNFLGRMGAGLASAALTRTSSAEDKPNVLLIYTDDQGTLDANCYGSKDLYTPTMDDLAKRGVRFTQAYAHTVCCPSRALLMTGRHPQRCNVNSWVQGRPADEGDGRPNMFLEEVTIAEVLKKAGYRTALVGKWHLGGALDHGPMEQGFDEYFGHRGGFIDNFKHWYLHGMGGHDLWRGKEEIYEEGHYFPDMTTREAQAFIERNRNNPFFLYLAFNIPHYPEQSDPKFDDRYADMPMPRQSYAKMVSTVDDRMGQVIGKLEELGLREKTIIIFMSDNGHSEEDYQIKVENHTSGYPVGHNYGANGGGGNTGRWIGHKGTFFEGGLRVPSVISFPAKLPEGVVRDQAITSGDYFPTICELCDVPLPDVKLDGQSLLPIIRDNAPSHHKVMHWQWQSKWAVREGDWKLICTPPKNPDPKDPNKGFFLGNLTGNKPEQEDFLARQPEVFERLKRLHEAWVKEVMPSAI